MKNNALRDCGSGLHKGLGFLRNRRGGCRIGRIESEGVENSRTVIKIGHVSNFTIACPCPKLDESGLKQFSQYFDGHRSGYFLFLLARQGEINDMALQHFKSVANSHFGYGAFLVHFLQRTISLGCKERKQRRQKI